MTLEELGKSAAALGAIVGFVLLVWHKLRLYVIWDWVTKHRAADLRAKRVAETTDVFRTLWTEERHALRNSVIEDTSNIIDEAIRHRIYPKLDQVREEVRKDLRDHMGREEQDSKAGAIALDRLATSQERLDARFDAFMAEHDALSGRVDILEADRLDP